MEYASINNVISENEKVKAYLNEKGKKKYKCKELFITCENSDIAENIVKILKEKYENK